MEIPVREETEFSKSIDHFKTIDNKEYVLLTPKSVSTKKQIVNLIQKSLD